MYMYYCRALALLLCCCQEELGSQGRDKEPWSRCRQEGDWDGDMCEMETLFYSRERNIIIHESQEVEERIVRQREGEKKKEDR